MSAFTKGRIVTIVLALLCLVAAQIACGSQAAAPVEQPAVQQPESTEESEEESEDSSQGESDDTLGEQNESVVEPEFGSETLPCPPKGSTLYLGFDHALTVNYGETSITHFLHEGYLQLQIIDDNGAIGSQGSPSLTYTMEGKMSDECSLSAEGTMTPSAHGSCESGVVNLFIEENWMALNGEMTCIDPDGDVAVLPFNVPPMGLQQHSGQNGAGEIFYLIEDAEGYSTMRPFLEGDGYHTWTLYTQDVPLVPLVP